VTPTPVTDLPPCPLGECAIPAPHAHPLLGEGLYGPSSARFKVGTVQVAAHCLRCGADFTATLVCLEGHAPPPAPITRTCDECLDRAEAACLAKMPNAATMPTYRDVAPAQRVEDE